MPGQSQGVLHHLHVPVEQCLGHRTGRLKRHLMLKSGRQMHLIHALL